MGIKFLYQLEYGIQDNNKMKKAYSCTYTETYPLDVISSTYSSSCNNIGGEGREQARSVQKHHRHWHGSMYAMQE